MKYCMEYKKFPKLLEFKTIAMYVIITTGWLLLSYLFAKLLVILFNGMFLPAIKHIEVIKHMLSPEFSGFQATHVAFFINSFIISIFLTNNLLDGNL